MVGTATSWEEKDLKLVKDRKLAGLRRPRRNDKVMKRLPLLLVLSLSYSIGLAQIRQEATARQDNSVSYLTGNLKLEKAVSEEYRKLTALLSVSAKKKASLASLAIGNRRIKSSGSFDLYRLAEEEVRKQFGRLTSQESDILVFYILAGSLERITTDKRQGSVSDKKDSLSEMSSMDQLVLQQAMEKKGQFESMFSDMLKTFQQTAAGVITNLKE